MRYKGLPIIILIISLCPFITVVNASPSSIVSLSGTIHTIAYPNQIRTFYDSVHGRYYVFHLNSTYSYVGYRFSSDGITWSPIYPDTEQWVDITRNAYWLDGVYVHETSNYVGHAGIFYRRGTIGGDGIISWGSWTDVEPISPSLTISCDSNGYPWIGYYNGTDSKPYVLKSSTKDGTFTIAEGFPYLVRDEAAQYAGWSVQCVPLSDGKMYVITVGSYESVAKGRLWDGDSWGDLETMTTSYTSYERPYDISATSTNDGIVHFIERDKNNVLRYVNRSIAGAWSSELNLGTGNCPQLIASGTALYLIEYQSDDICYRLQSGGAWGAWILLEDESSLTDSRSSAFPFAQDHKISYAYVRYNGDAYEIKFIFMELIAPPPPGIPYYLIFDHRDLDNDSIDLRITWNLYNGTQLLTYTEGDLTLINYTAVEGENVTLKTFYHNILLNTSFLPFSEYYNTTVLIYMQMKEHTSLGTWPYAYAAFNNTITSIIMNMESNTNLTFTVTGSSPIRLIIDVPRAPEKVQRNHKNLAGWIYVIDKSYVLYNASTLSTYEFYCPLPQGIYPQWNMLLEWIVISLILMFFGFIKSGLKLLAFIGNFIIIILGGYMLQMRYVVYESVYYADGWVDHVMQIPYYPVLPIMFCIVGAILLLSSFRSVYGEKT